MLTSGQRHSVTPGQRYTVNALSKLFHVLKEDSKLSPKLTTKREVPQRVRKAAFLNQTKGKAVTQGTIKAYFELNKTSGIPSHKCRGEGGELWCRRCCGFADPDTDSYDQSSSQATTQWRKPYLLDIVQGVMVTRTVQNQDSTVSRDSVRTSPGCHSSYALDSENRIVGKPGGQSQ